MKIVEFSCVAGLYYEWYRSWLRGIHANKLTFQLFRNYTWKGHLGKIKKERKRERRRERELESDWEEGIGWEGWGGCGGWICCYWINQDLKSSSKNIVYMTFFCADITFDYFDLQVVGETTNYNFNQIAHAVLILFTSILISLQNQKNFYKLFKFICRLLINYL